jgi:hypothetical protein
MIMTGTGLRRWWLPAGAVLAVLVVLGVVPALGSFSDPDPDPEPAGAASVSLSCGTADEPTCARMIADFARRAPLTDTERRGSEAVSDRMSQVLSSAVSAARSCEPGDVGCLVAPTVPSADGVRRALAAAGFELPVARLARAGDLAPEGSLVAVNAGAGCVVLIQDRDSQGGFIGGRLPGGGCLTA